MKKIILFLCLFISALSYAQVNTEADAPKFPQDIEKKYELKINALTLLAAKWIMYLMKTFLTKNLHLELLQL